jgi:hypothetical protein
LGRKLRPKWQIIVDAFLFRYVDDPGTIRAQQNRIKELELTGVKTTPAYSLAGGISGGESVTKEERYVQDLEHAREQIEVCRERRVLVAKMLQEHFNEEEQTFIRLFWLDVKPIERGFIWERNRRVIQEIRWFMDPDKRDRPSDAYYDWRTRIYNKWWTLLWPDRGKDDTKVDHIEQGAMDNQSAYLNAKKLKTNLPTAGQN